MTDNRKLRPTVIDHIITFVMSAVIVGAVSAFAILTNGNAKASKDIPRIISCDFTEQIFVQSLKGKQWPVGNIYGCRCKLEYNGRIYIDFENQDRSLCTSE